MFVVVLRRLSLAPQEEEEERKLRQQTNERFRDFCKKVQDGSPEFTRHCKEFDIPYRYAGTQRGGKWKHDICSAHFFFLLSLSDVFVDVDVFMYVHAPYERVFYGVCLCVCCGERERERECVCVCVCV